MVRRQAPLTVIVLRNGKLISSLKLFKGTYSGSLKDNWSRHQNVLLNRSFPLEATVKVGVIWSTTKFLLGPLKMGDVAGNCLPERRELLCKENDVPNEFTTGWCSNLP